MQKLRSFFTTQFAVFLKARADLAKLEPELRHINDARRLLQVETARSILSLPDPTGRIPELSGLLLPVQAQVQAILQRQVTEVQQAGSRVRERVSNYARSVHTDVSDRLDLTTLTQPIAQVAHAADSALSIDSAIARQSELENLYVTLVQQVDRQATEILETLREQEPDLPLPVMKPIVPVEVVRVAPKPVLESVEDVDDYLNTLRTLLMQEIAQNKRVRLE